MKTLLSCVLLLFIQNTAFATSFAKVSLLIGKAQVVRSGKSQNLKMGDPLKLKDRISTAAQAVLVLKFNSGAQIKINADSEVVLKEPSTKGLELIKGSAFAKVPKTKGKSKKKNIFKIYTRSATAGVRGTEFFISYGSQTAGDDIWLCVNEGRVEVTQTGKKFSVMVKEGEGISVTANKGISNPKPLAWTKKLNWNMAGEDIVNKVNIEEAYTDLLDKDYD